MCQNTSTKKLNPQPPKHKRTKIIFQTKYSCYRMTLYYAAHALQEHVAQPVLYVTTRLQSHT